MAHTDRWITRRPADASRDDANRQTQALAGLAAALLIVAVSLFLVRELRAVSAVEDCLMAGRQNCDLMVSRFH